MANKTKITVTYDDDSTETIEISSANALTDTLSTIKSNITGFADLIQLSRSIDAFLRAHDIKKVEGEEEEE